MTVTTITAVAALAFGAKLPAGSDPSFETYFTQALSYCAAEPHRAMAMLELLLVPEKTEVSVDLSGLPESVRDRFKQGFERGFNLWDRALGKDFPFELRFTDQIRLGIEARVVDRIDGDYHQMGELFVTRRVSWSKRTHRAELTGTLKISRYSRPGRLLSAEEVTHIVAHELGHALGLGDTESVREIMGPVLIGRPFARLTADEVRRVRSIRESIREEYRVAQASAN
jgi:hypothetical protein